MTKKLSNTVILGLRQAFAKVAVHLPFVELASRQRGDLLSRFNNDTTVAAGILEDGVLKIVSASVMFITAIICMILVDASLFIITVFAILLGLVAVLFSGQVVQRLSLNVQSSLAEMTHRFERVFESLPLIRAYGATQRELVLLSESTETVYEDNLKLAKLNASVQPIGAVTIQIALLICLTAGGYRVSQNMLTIGGLLAFIMFLFMMVTPVMQIINGYIALQTGLAAMYRIDDVLDAPSELDLQEANTFDVSCEVASSQNAISFRKVEFTFPGTSGSKFRLGPLDLDIRSGEHIAFVGPSGSGKSTIVSLIERFYIPDSGTILVDGRQQLEYDIESYRSMRFIHG